MSVKTKQLISAVTCLTAAAIALTACGSGTSAEADTKAASSMYTWISNDNDRQQWQAFVDAAKTKDAGFNLTLEGPSFPDYWTKVKTRLASAGAPCIITTQAARAQELKDVLAPLNDLVKKNNVDTSVYNQAMISGMTVDGELRALPYDAEPMVLYYNKDLFKAAGLKEPSTNYTRDQFLADAKALTDQEKFGFALPPQLSAGPGLAFAFADGHQPVKDGALDLANPDFVKDIQWTFDLVAKDGVAKAPQSSDSSDVAQQQFMSGEAAMLVDGPWMYEQFTTKTTGEVGIAVIPSTSGTPSAMVQGSGFGIAASCKDKEAAFQNIMKITTPEVIGTVGATRGTVPSIQSVVKEWAGKKPAGDVSVVEALLANGQPLQTTSNWNQVDTQFTQYSVEGFRGSKTAAGILDTISASTK